MIEAHNFRQDKEDRLMFALEHVNLCRSIAKAKSKLQGDDLKEFKRSLKDLDEIFVNPVTIPKKWGVKHIPNPLRAYHEHIYDEQLIFNNEFAFLQLLNEYLDES